MALNLSKLFGRGGSTDNLALSGDVDPMAGLTADGPSMLNNKYPENLAVRVELATETGEASNLVADNDEASDVDESAEVEIEESLSGGQPSEPSAPADPATADETSIAFKESWAEVRAGTTDGKFGPETEAAKVLSGQGSGTDEQIRGVTADVFVEVDSSAGPVSVVEDATDVILNVRGQEPALGGPDTTSRLRMNQGDTIVTENEHPKGLYLRESDGGANVTGGLATPGVVQFEDIHLGVQGTGPGGPNEPLGFDRGYISPSAALTGAQAPDTETSFDPAHPYASEFTGSDEQLNFLIEDLRTRGLIDTSTGEVVWADEASANFTGSDEEIGALIAWLQQRNLIDTSTGEITWARQPVGEADGFMVWNGETVSHGAAQGGTQEAGPGGPEGLLPYIEHSNVIDTTTGEVEFTRIRPSESGYQVGASPEVADPQALSMELMFDTARVAGGSIDEGSFERGSGPGGHEANLDVYGGNSGSPAVEFESQTRPHADGWFTVPEVDDEVLLAAEPEHPDIPLLQAREGLPGAAPNAAQDVFVTELVSGERPLPEGAQVSVGGFGGGVDDDRINDQTPADWNEHGRHRPDGEAATEYGLTDKGITSASGIYEEHTDSDVANEVTGGLPFIVPAENANVVGFHEDENADGDFDDRGETSRRSFGLNNGFDQEGTSAGVVDETTDRARQGVWGQLPPDRSATADHPLRDDMAFLSGAEDDGQAPGVTNARELALDDFLAATEGPPNDASSFKTLSGMDSETEVVESTSLGSQYVDTATTAGLKYETEVTDYREGGVNQFNPKEVSVDRVRPGGDARTKWEGPDFDAGKNEVSIETLEIAHEGLSVREAGARGISLDTWEHGVHDGPSTLLDTRGGDDPNSDQMPLNFEEVKIIHDGSDHDGEFDLLDADLDVPD